MGNCATGPAGSRSFRFRLSQNQLAGDFPEDELEFYFEINALLDRWTHNQIGVLKTKFLEAVSKQQGGQWPASQSGGADAASKTRGSKVGKEVDHSGVLEEGKKDHSKHPTGT